MQAMDLGRTTAGAERFHIDIECPLEPLCPSHSRMALGGCFFVLTIRSFGLVAFATNSFLVFRKKGDAASGS